MYCGFYFICDKTEHCIKIFTDWHEAKVEAFHQIQYGELITFLGLANYVNWFVKNGVNWNDALPDGVRSRSHFIAMLVIDGGKFPVEFHPLLTNQHFRDQYDHFLTGIITGY